MKKSIIFIGLALVALSACQPKEQAFDYTVDKF